MFHTLFANCLLVENFDNSLHFYRDILGLEVNNQDGHFADFKLNGTSLAIFQKSDAIAMFPEKYMGNGGGIVLGFQVSNVQTAWDELKKNGVMIIEGPKTTEWGQTVAYFFDPDNNIWEVSQL
ncbi:hypothetical protein HGA88_00860 [Candidatus Roizmanbacteria bacterium]|nr:hypothetical protein [Candidatus Roizmanbacteria bacterium]